MKDTKDIPKIEPKGEQSEPTTQITDNQDTAKQLQEQDQQEDEVSATGASLSSSSSWVIETDQPSQENEHYSPKDTKEQDDH